MTLSFILAEYSESLNAYILVSFLRHIGRKWRIFPTCSSTSSPLAYTWLLLYRDSHSIFTIIKVFDVKKTRPVQVRPTVANKGGYD